MPADRKPICRRCKKSFNPENWNDNYCTPCKGEMDDKDYRESADPDDQPNNVDVWRK